MQIRFIITAGGTREPIDEVRYIGNTSTGRLGAAVADEALGRGHEVVFIHFVNNDRVGSPPVGDAVKASTIEAEPQFRAADDHASHQFAALFGSCGLTRQTAAEVRGQAGRGQLGLLRDLASYHGVSRRLPQP